jgi:hypothetical protein
MAPGNPVLKLLWTQIEDTRQYRTVKKKQIFRNSHQFLVDSDPRTREWFPFNVYSTQRQKQVRQNNEVTQLTLIQV